MELKEAEVVEEAKAAAEEGHAEEEEAAAVVHDADPAGLAMSEPTDTAAPAGAADGTGTEDEAEAAGEAEAAAGEGEAQAAGEEDDGAVEVGSDTPCSPRHPLQPYPSLLN